MDRQETERIHTEIQDRVASRKKVSGKEKPVKQPKRSAKTLKTGKNERRLSMSENLKEAKMSLIKWINITAEDKMREIQIDDESGKTFRFNWEEAFERTTDDAYEQVGDWGNDFELTYDEERELENYIRELHADTFQRELDKLEEYEKQSKVNQVMKIAFGA